MCFKHNHYTVVWSCALLLEMAEAKALLDKIQPLLTFLDA